ncbi:MAG: FxLYD domain-containing protein [Candidatus Nitrosopolaris sp.]
MNRLGNPENGYALSASYQQAYTSKPAALALNVGRSNLDVINAYHLLGEVTNQGNNTATFAKVSGVFFDANHKVIDVVDTYTSPSDLQPRQKAPFDLQSLSPNARDIKFASINIQSNEYSLINNQPLISANNNALLGNGTLPSTTPLTNSITSGSSTSHQHHSSSGGHHSGSSSKSSPKSSIIHIPKIRFPHVRHTLPFS